MAARRDPRYRNLPKLWQHIAYQLQVRDAIFKGEPPRTDCVTANAYDFRVPDIPTHSAVAFGLLYLGVRNLSRGDLGVFVTQELQRLAGFYSRDVPDGTYLSPADMKRMIVSFRHYNECKRGAKQWKLLPKTLL